MEMCSPTTSLSFSQDRPALTRAHGWRRTSRQRGAGCGLWDRNPASSYRMTRRPFSKPPWATAAGGPQSFAHRWDYAWEKGLD